MILRLVSSSILLLSLTGSAGASPVAYVPFYPGGASILVHKIDLAGPSWAGAAALSAVSPPSTPLSIALPPDETAVYVAGGAEGTLWKIDPATLRPTAQVSIGCEAAGVAVMPDHQRIYVACREGEVKEFTASLQQTRATVAPGGPLSTISVNSGAGQHRGRIYVTAQTAVYVLYPDSLTFKQVIWLPGCRLDFPVQWKGTDAYVLCNGEGGTESAVHRIDACAGDVVHTGGCWPKRLTHVVSPLAMAFTPSKRYLFVTGEEGRLEKFRADNCETVAIGAVPDGGWFSDHALGLADVSTGPDELTRLAVPALDFALAHLDASATQIRWTGSFVHLGQPVVSGLLTAPPPPDTICPYCQP